MTLLHLPFFAALAAFAVAVRAEVRVTANHASEGMDFRFPAVPPPSKNDAATEAMFSLVDGPADSNGGPLTVLHDGRLPTDEDEPAASFFFRAGSDGGRIAVDLGRVVAVKQVNTYSWHPGSRGPQVYRLYAAEGTADGFLAAPRRGTDPTTCGWKLVTAVDTRPASGEGGGQHGVSIADPTGDLGRWRHLLFDVARTQEGDPFGHTFFNEVDVVDAAGPAPVPATSGDREPVLRTWATADGRHRFTLDATAAPDLLEWAETTLRPVVETWYPKLVAMLPSEGFEAAPQVRLSFRNGMGVPAAAGGARVSLSAPWFRRELEGEALGAVVHELVHVVQDYGRARRRNAEATRTPGWVVEGLADYIRWFLYEPETNGAEITAQNLDRARHDASYRITGNFMDWVTRNHEPELARKLNVAAREGRYSDTLWKDWTGRTLPELDAAWRQANKERLGAAADP